MNPWHERFLTKEYMYGEQPNTFIKNFAQHLKDCRNIAAYAEGEGRNVVYLASKGHTMTAFDYAQSGLDKTEELAKKRGVTVQTELIDLLHDEISVEIFDAAIMVFGHFQHEQQQDVFARIVRSVKPGGIIVMELYSIYQLPYASGDPKQIDFLYDPTDVLTWCKPHKIIHFFTGEQIRNEGILHTGLAHTIQLIIQKS